MDTPICDFVNKYIDSDFSRFHMPGHKGKEFIGCERQDITEIDGADVLSHADGIIKKSQENAAKLFGSGATFYSTEGSSQCIKTMLAAVFMDYKIRQEQKSSGSTKSSTKPFVLAARNVHKSMIDALALLDLSVEFMYPKDADSICVSMVTPDDVKRELEKKQKPVAIYITSPDYLGNTADIEGISKVCEKCDIPLIVDNAHGAYQAFLDEKKYGTVHPIQSGAAICCDSAHKTLPVLTGGAYIHVSEKYRERLAHHIASYMTIFGSTSPSYLIMQSLDMCNRYLDGKFKDELADCIKRIEKTKAVLAENNVSLMETEPLKIVIDTAAAGMQGEELADELRRYRIECEYADKYFVVLMITPQNDEIDFERLEKWAFDTKDFRNKKGKLVPQKLVLSRAERVMGIREAVFSPYKKVRVSDACGRICASQTIACPPAIPIAVCGERIDENMMKIFKEYAIEYINVVDNSYI